jgi:hypothetical protein
MSDAPGLERFELELLGGGVERRYRALRPEVERMPWGRFDAATLDEATRARAQRDWTASAFQEYRTALACAATVHALLDARAPVDLVAVASRFPLDELVHVELCARMAMAHGGGAAIEYAPGDLIDAAPDGLPPLLAAADMAVRFFCVGETASVAMLRRAWKSAKDPLSRAILGRIVKDEAAHGAFGWIFLDWALPQLDAPALAHLGVAATGGVAGLRMLWDDVRARMVGPGVATYFALAEQVLADRIVAPLAQRGIVVAQ